jgi:hypothetical protein
VNKNRFANFNLSSHAQGLNNIGIAKGKQESPTILGSFFFRSSLLLLYTMNSSEQEPEVRNDFHFCSFLSVHFVPHSFQQVIKSRKAQKLRT